jgi:hypothetical protein
MIISLIGGMLRSFICLIALQHITSLTRASTGFVGGDCIPSTACAARCRRRLRHIERDDIAPTAEARRFSRGGTSGRRSLAIKRLALSLAHCTPRASR